MITITIETPTLLGEAPWEPNAPITLGGDPSSDLTISGVGLAPRHLQVIPSGKVRAIEPLVANGRAVPAGGEAPISEGAIIEAASTRITISRRSAPEDPLARAPGVRAVTWRATSVDGGALALVAPLFSGLSSPRYALLDGARDRAVYRLVRGSGWRSVCLFPPEHEVRLGREAPHLLRLPDDPTTWGGPGVELLSGFGKSFGVFLTSRGDHPKIALSLRRLLTVYDDEGPLYFRYYDPRVARDFLPIATPYQASLLFDEAELLFVEGEDGASMIQFSERRLDEG